MGCENEISWDSGRIKHMDTVLTKVDTGPFQEMYMHITDPGL